MPKKDTNAPNMPGHAARTQQGRLRKIREDTQMGTLKQRYHVDLGVRSDMEWGTFKEKFDIDSVKEALEKK
ncbi:MAG: hypothetical protein UT55_C0037G0012 [Candidatus Peregrinibacteria bacterium GW2011_GWE2_39_6]|nr:MAG: hypothetical protein UT36_C0003G0059 [Candidatus Peregrinibacteria bacterium GW2011_GWF2_39_17]KKR25593.1 MAG: hypothetical protein UT55_C0037G0012 [Candidatus Peregrinibacteria bacterium GW2011_GWE2_39_6]HCW31979.1 hypothetical protein [Candidatus Peregrinibacteria bacterium]